MSTLIDQSESVATTERGTSRLRLRPDVTVVVQDGIGRVLDLNRGRFYALNPTGTRLLKLALDIGPDAAVREIATEYGVDSTVVARDWERLCRDLVRAKLLTSVRPLVAPGPARVWLLLALAWLSVQLFGWCRSVRLWRLGRVRPAPADPRSDELVAEVDRLVRRVAAGHALNPQCKERALVAWHLLRNRFGLPADLVVGILAYPFQAHAWVECAGRVVTDDALKCELFTPAARWE